MSEPRRESTSTPPALITREQIDHLIEHADFNAARAALCGFWRQSPGAAVAGFTVTRFEKLRGHVPLATCRLFILRSFTIEPAVPLLRAMAFAGGIDLSVQLGDFNVYSQEILDPASSLYGFKPDVVILASHTADAAPDLWETFADLSSADAEAAVNRTAAHFRQLLTVFRSRSAAHLVLHSLQAPAEPAAGVLDAGLEKGQRQAIFSINDALRQAARETNNVYLLDYNAMIARRGEVHWEDRAKWIAARMPIAAAELATLAKQWLRFLHPITGKTCKAVAVDLDNTLWGGVIGEDGLDGIKLGSDYRGIAWRDVQRALLDLYRRGIILAVCSKNNPADAMDAIARHPEMLLRPEHFAAVRANWNDKATNLREIAAELNIGLDAIAFLDDNPVEREWVRRQAPEVTIIELPANASGFAQAIRDTPVFERLSLSAEDRERGRYYAEQRLRTELQESAGSIEDFYRSLEMKVQIAPVNAQSLSRAAQLTQKTNQFNLTTRRYTEEQMAELLKLPQWRLRTIRVVDRFGDNGIVGLVMVRTDGSVAEIDNFLLSCRVIGRTVETALLQTIVEEGRGAGAERVIGRYIPSKKNAPAKEFYPLHGFTSEDQSEWHLDLRTQSLRFPEWIELI